MVAALGSCGKWPLSVCGHVKNLSEPHAGCKIDMLLSLRPFA